MAKCLKSKSEFGLFLTTFAESKVCSGLGSALVVVGTVDVESAEQLPQFFQFRVKIVLRENSSGRCFSVWWTLYCYTAAACSRS